MPSPSLSVRRRGLLVACLVAILSRTAGAQATGTPHGSSPTATTPAIAVVDGVATDSMHGGPLIGAQVMLDGTTRAAVSDSAGRFRFDSLAPGQVRLGIYHPVLDSIGIGLASGALTVQPGATLSIALATPSPVTVENLLCSATAAPQDGSGGPSVIVGRVLDAETEEPIAGAHVGLRWTDMQVGAQIGVRHVERTRDTVTNAAGAFHFCWVPALMAGALRATRSDQADGIDRAFAMTSRRVALVVLHVPGMTAGSSAGAELIGRVTQADGRPVAGARVQIAGGDSAVTADSGHFHLHGLPTGSRTLIVRAVGWNPLAVPVELSVRAPQQVVVPLGEKAAVLQAVVVQAQLETGYHRVGFDRRKASGTGTYLTAADIEKHNAGDFHDLLIGVPGVQVSSSRRGQVFLTGSRANRCIRYTVDGAPYREMSRGDIDSFVRPDEIGAIEVYESSAVPSELVIGPGTVCTNVIIWTKTRLGL
jgi:hypothetical protein